MCIRDSPRSARGPPDIRRADSADSWRIRPPLRPGWNAACLLYTSSEKDCIIDISPSSSIPIPIHNRTNRLPGRPAGGFCLCREDVYKRQHPPHDGAVPPPAAAGAAHLHCGKEHGHPAVSYTHLDVYKRQVQSDCKPKY